MTLEKLARLIAVTAAIGTATAPSALAATTTVAPVERAGTAAPVLVAAPASDGTAARDGCTYSGNGGWGKKYNCDFFGSSYSCYVFPGHDDLTYCYKRV